ncbi:MAG: site-specific integrase [Oscillospiraceae bacterium]|nr:site-specific integrase [Oscillospiraceae bacterium]
MAKKAAKGGGTIRKKTVTRSGKEYTYWEARITTGRDPGTGKQIQRSITGKTQKEVREKLAQAVAEVDRGTYTAPTKLTVGQWLDIWTRDYLGGVKSTTAAVYRASTKTYIKPALGAVRLDQLHPHAVQGFINSLGELAPATVRLTHGVLHHALEKAVELGYIKNNPAARSTLPKIEREEPRPLDDDQVAALLKVVKGGDMEHLVTVALFTGLRMSELLGLTWDAIDFEDGTITVNKQLSRQGHRAVGLFQSPKSNKIRTITPAGVVFDALKRQRAKQAKMQLRAGPVWDNPHGLVFTVGDGGPFNQSKAGRGFKTAVAAAGMPDFHFHSLRHTYAVNAIRAGDDIKTVQSNLGHATAAFTLDKYGHVTERMKRDSAQRMEHFIKDVMNL